MSKVELPKRKRGRPSKAEQAAYEAAKKAGDEAHKKTPDGQHEEFLNEQLSRGYVGRKPKLEATPETIRTMFELAKILATQAECASVLGVHERTFRQFLHDNEDARAAWDDGISHGKISLRRKQLAMADKNAPAAIFLGKNILGQKDIHHTNTTITRNANELSEDELLEIIERGKGSKQKPAPTLQ